MRCLLAVIFVVAVPHQLLAAEAKGGDADAFNTEHIFGFVDGSDIGEKGEKEIETETVGRFGRIGAMPTRRPKHPFAIPRPTRCASRLGRSAIITTSIIFQASPIGRLRPSAA